MYFLVYFINNMNLNIHEEYTKLIQVINDDTFDFLKFVKMNDIVFDKPHVEFLWTVLTLTIKYPQVELYLKNLLNYFTIDELEEISDGRSILHQMTGVPYEISLNAFEIMINFGININIKNCQGNTLAHMITIWQCDTHISNILNLLIKYGANLNIRNKGGRTVLDILTCSQIDLGEETKNCIMTLVDFGARTNYPEKNMIYDFIEYYKNLGIKPAIKNEK